MKEATIKQAYEIARERYAELGIDTEKALETLQNVQISLHCWQADDVAGFESTGDLTGGIQATGRQGTQYRRAPCRHPQGSLVHRRQPPSQPP